MTRQRRWHSRVFTGCASCRQRHVKCGEEKPTCARSERLSLNCDYPQTCQFKLYIPSVGQVVSQGSGSYSIFTEGAASSIRTEEGDEASAPGSLSPSFMIQPPQINHFAPPSCLSSPQAFGRLEITTPDFNQDDASPLGTWLGGTDHRTSPFAGIVSPQDMYYQHFLTTVCSTLIIYDTPANSNAYRLLPRFADSSGMLRDIMIALGAMNLANLPWVQTQRLHARVALETYASVVERLRGAVSSNQLESKLEFMAITLLLCIFEMMSSKNTSWRIHLRGARQAFNEIYNPCIDAGENRATEERSCEIILPAMRRFLVSTLAWLDVAAACATGDGTLIPGDYWETFGGGWEYNLGVPSLNPGHTSADRILAQLRHSWSRIMSIQASISNLANLKKGGLCVRQSRIFFEDILARLGDWRATAPDIYHRLSSINKMPVDSTVREVEVLVAAACIICYEKACLIYLYSTQNKTLSLANSNPQVSAAVETILHLSTEFATGINQLAILWPLFITGTAVTDAIQQDVLRQLLNSMECFGLKVSSETTWTLSFCLHKYVQHTSRALDILEYIWLQNRLFGEIDYEQYEKLLGGNLVP